MSIHVIGDRRNTGFCIKCGKDLQIPWNDFQCCTKCTKKLEHLIGVTKKRKEKVTKVGKKVVNSRTVMRQRKPIGGIPQ